MLVNDCRDVEDIGQNEFYVVLFTANACTEPCSILKFYRTINSQRKSKGSNRYSPWMYTAYKLPDICKEDEPEDEQEGGKEVEQEGDAKDEQEEEKDGNDREDQQEKEKEEEKKGGKKEAEQEGADEDKGEKEEKKEKDEEEDGEEDEDEDQEANEAEFNNCFIDGDELILVLSSIIVVFHRENMTQLTKTRSLIH